MRNARPVYEASDAYKQHQEMPLKTEYGRSYRPLIANVYRHLERALTEYPMLKNACLKLIRASSEYKSTLKNGWGWTDDISVADGEEEEEEEEDIAASESSGDDEEEEQQERRRRREEEEEEEEEEAAELDEDEEVEEDDELEEISPETATVQAAFFVRGSARVGWGRNSSGIEKFFESIWPQANHTERKYMERVMDEMYKTRTPLCANCHAVGDHRFKKERSIFIVDYVEVLGGLDWVLECKPGLRQLNDSGNIMSLPETVAKPAAQNDLNNEQIRDCREKSVRSWFRKLVEEAIDVNDI